jgi:uncharacterized protein YyaL (SSP411 family)
MGKDFNKLKNEKSRYLIQHARNPVQWYPWGEEALKKAQIENKMLFISIGYSACHWCHVMEHESFENKEIAEILNRNFIAIKVDREERPDIDNSYMSAIQLMNGSGGWPLSCFTTPDARPFYGGTYYPPEQFKEVLNQLIQVWTENPEKIIDHANSLCEGVQDAELVKVKCFNSDLPDPTKLYENLVKQFDLKNGGLSRVPKFPLMSNYQFLFDYSCLVRSQDSASHARFTLKKILNGGIYDQLEGGISRYSVDRYWLVPHFEKMLYDNAQLVSFIAKAILNKKDSFLMGKLDHCMKFLETQMKSPKGGYYSSYDADSEGEEGKYYVWTYKEIEKVTGDYCPLISAYYGVKEDGNWESGKNILHIKKGIPDLARENGISIDKASEIIEKCNLKLLEHRLRRPRPGLDDKIITSWNSILLKAFTEAYQATGEERYKDKAANLAKFIKNYLIMSDFKLKRGFELNIPGFLEDYAFAAEAFLNYYQISFDEEYLILADKIVQKTYLHFFDNKTGMFFYSPDFEGNPVARQSDIIDNVIPSANSVMAKSLFLLSVYMDKPDYRKHSKQMLMNVVPHFDRSISFFSNWASLLLMFKAKFSEVVILGENYKEIRNEFSAKNIPFTMFAGRNKENSTALFKSRFKEGKTSIYVCRNMTCQMPVYSVEDALKQLEA